MIRHSIMRPYTFPLRNHCLAVLAVLGTFSILSRAQSVNLVNAPVDSAVRVVLRGQHAPWALPQNDLSPVPGETRLEHLTLVLKRSPAQQKAFEDFLQTLQDPASPSFHRWLTPIQLGQRFGTSQHDIDAVSAWLVAQGLRVNSVSNSRMMIDFSGNASHIGATFATELRYYLVHGEQRMAAADDPQIPNALVDVIQSVSGLYTVNDHSYSRMKVHEVPAPAGSDLPALSICNNGSCSYFVTPEDFAVIYFGSNLTNPTGDGQTIAIIGRSRVYDPDIENFESLTGLEVKTPDPVVIVPPNGVDPGAPASTGTASEDQLEATLDVSRVISIAPDATVDLVISADDEATDVNGLRIAATYVVDTTPIPAQIMNISFGACEADRTLSDVQFWDSLFGSAAAEGISVFVASGDAGAAGCDTYFKTPPATQVASPNYICSSSYPTCAGGTEFADASDPGQYWSQTNGGYLGSALSYIPEGGWNEPLNSSGDTQAASSGGGYSSYIPTPTWQVGTGVPGTQGRYTPDIAFSASEHDGYFACMAASGGTHPGSCVSNNGYFYFVSFSGTSAAAPDMAGITALLNQQMGTPQGELNPRLYALAANPPNAVFHDVTVATSAVSGCVVTTPSMCNNSTPSPTALTGGLAGYLVTPGYDEVTGWGSINVSNLIHSWTATSATTITVSSNSNPAPEGALVEFIATVKATGTDPLTGSVAFYDGTTQIGGSDVNNGVGAAATTALALGSNSITAVYQGDANNAASVSPVLNQTITAPLFTWAPLGNGTATVLSGQTASYYIGVEPLEATSFAANVTFSCPTLPDSTFSCSFNPATISAGGAGTNVQLTITTSGPNTSAENKRQRAVERRALWLPLALPLAGILLSGLFPGLWPGRLSDWLSGNDRRSLWKHAATGMLCVSLLSAGLLLACGGGGGKSGPPPITVTVGPGTPASVFPNNSADNWPSQTAQFTATVTGASSSAVTWTVTTSNGGTIDANGLYTAPTIAAGLPSNITIQATSVASPSVSGTGQETLKAATIPGTYSNIMVTATEGTTVNSAPVTLTVN
jgi:hypothetical protein